jgi:HK97 family phage major capsid protein
LNNETQQLEIEIKQIRDDILAAIDGKVDKDVIASMQTQLDTLDKKMQDRLSNGSGSNEDPLKKAIEASPEFSRLKELGNGRCTIKVGDLFETKTTVTDAALGIGTSGVIAPQGVGGIVPLAQRRFFLRDLLNRGNRVTSGAAYFVKESAFTNAASIQTAEGNAKAESANTFTTVQRNVATVSHWLPISRQAIQDAPAILDFVRNKLIYGLNFEVEKRLLFGSGSGLDLEGLATAATAYDTSLNSTSYTKADLLRRALEQVEIADEVPAGFFCLNPADWASLELLKDSNNRYLIGDPSAATTPRLWGRPVIVTNAMPSTHFLCGSAESAEVLTRLDDTLEISLDFSDYRSKNLAMILCETRIVNCIFRPAAFIYGSLASSP